MFYGHKVLALVIGISGLAYGAGALANADSEGEVDKRSDIAFRHVMFEQYQENHRAAYIAADYYRERQIDNEAMTLAKAAASLELGYLEHGRALIAELEQIELLPENQSRLRLYLARDAYRRRDWPLLEAQLEQLAELELDGDQQQNYQSYLHMELSRHQGELETASNYFEQLDEEFPLRLNALFNLAVSHTDDPEQSIELLNDLVDQPARDFPQLMLIDRARVALAELYIGQTDLNAARGHLAKVSATEQYGPRALAQLARIEMFEERFENAAAIWQHLSHNYPWHRASTHATSGMGYALQMSRGNEAAFGVYSGGLQKMVEHNNRLDALTQAIQEQLDSPEMFESENESLLVWLADGLGHEDWLSWFASAEVRGAASRWQALDQAYGKLIDDGDHLDALLDVDREQQARVRHINQVVVDGGLVTQLNDLTEEALTEKQYLVNKKFRYEDEIKGFASAQQLANLAEVEYLEKSLADLGPKGSVQAEEIKNRIQRLKGLVRFEIFDQVPREKQKQVSELDRKLAIAQNSSMRLERILAAAEHQPMSVSSRIQLLALKREFLEQETLLALNESRDELLVGLNDLVTQDQARLAKQMAGLQYDITRLTDLPDIQVSRAEP